MGCDDWSNIQEVGEMTCVCLLESSDGPNFFSLSLFSLLLLVLLVVLAQKEEHLFLLSFVQTKRWYMHLQVRDENVDFL